MASLKALSVWGLLEPSGILTGKTSSAVDQPSSPFMIHACNLDSALPCMK